MCSLSKSASSSCSSDDDSGELRRGPWTVEEDALLVSYISSHGEGRWNLLAKLSGLKRTGKSCRLRWLNYLKPDVKRGNLTPQEQLLILQLHSKWGNRWSKIAQHLPSRTDNEIKNYWRTRVQKQARHLKIDSTSKEFQELIRCVWMPRLIQKIQGSSSSTTTNWDSSSMNSLESDQSLIINCPSSAAQAYNYCNYAHNLSIINNGASHNHHEIYSNQTMLENYGCSPSMSTSESNSLAPSIDHDHYSYSINDQSQNGYYNDNVGIISSSDHNMGTFGLGANCTAMGGSKSMELDQAGCDFYYNNGENNWVGDELMAYGLEQYG